MDKPYHDPAYSGNGTLMLGSPNFYSPSLRYWILLANAGCRFLVGMVGLVTNLFLVYVITSEQALRNSCGLLLAFVAASDALVGGSSVFTLYYALTDNTQIDAHLCFWEISPAVFAFNMTLGLMFAIGFDRLCSVAFPIWHMHVNSLGNSRTKQFYLAGILIAATGVAFWLVYQDFTHMNSSLIKCTVDEVMLSTLPNNVSLVINLATIVCYLLMPVAMRCRGGVSVASTESSQTKGLNRSVAVLVFIVAGCWMASIAFRSFAPQIFPVMNIPFFLTTMGWALLTSVSQSANAFVLYVCSVYRARMRKTLAQLFAPLHRRNQSSSTTQQFHNRRRSGHGQQSLTVLQRQQQQPHAMAPVSGGGVGRQLQTWPQRASNHHHHLQQQQQQRVAPIQISVVNVQ